MNLRYNQPRQLIVIGNSLLSYNGAKLVGAKTAPLYLYSQLTGNRPPISIFATPGISISELITEFPTVIAPVLRSGDVVLFDEVINELGDSQSPSGTFDYLVDYANLVQGLGAKIVVMTCTARVEPYVGFETDRLALNTLIRNNSSEFDGLADSGGLTIFNSVSATLDTTNYNADRLHFSNTGYNEFITPAISPVQTLLNA